MKTYNLKQKQHQNNIVKITSNIPIKSTTLKAGTVTIKTTLATSTKHINKKRTMTIKTTI